jgi:hypothetical protein
MCIISPHESAKNKVIALAITLLKPLEVGDAGNAEDVPAEVVAVPDWLNPGDADTEVASLEVDVGMDDSDGGIDDEEGFVAALETLLVDGEVDSDGKEVEPPVGLPPGATLDFAEEAAALNSARV